MDGGGIVTKLIFEDLAKVKWITKSEFRGHLGHIAVTAEQVFEGMSQPQTVANLAR
jgi:hypothetical protein